MYLRICIFGRPGSGKSTFALKLHKKMSLPVYHLDRYFFVANWVARDYEEFLLAQHDIVDQDQWIVDGNSLQSLEIRYARAQICLYFNYSRWICLFRIIKRFFTKDSAIKDRAEGCKENIRFGLIKYMWTFEQRLNGRLIYQIAELQRLYPEVKFIEINNDRDLEKVYSIFGL
jgi:adenylate kinase family enzyme